MPEAFGISWSPGSSPTTRCEATVRMAGNLGFTVHLAEDACFTYARRDHRGHLRSAEEVHAMSLANLDGEYCRVTRTAEILG